MGAAGDRLEREPGKLPRGSLDHRIIGDGVAGAFVAVAGFRLALALDIATAAGALTFTTVAFRLRGLARKGSLLTLGKRYGAAATPKFYS